jgi:phage-related protein
MSTYSESVGFWYNDRHSSEFGILNVHTQSGLFDESFMASRSIIEEKTFGRNEPYFMGFEYSPLSIPLTLFFEGKWDEFRLHEVVTWLNQPVYSPLIFDEDINRIFYCVYDGDPRLFHAGLREGYVTLNMRCNSPFSFTPIDERDFTFTNNTLGEEIELFNIGHTDCLPTIKIEKTGTGDISIINHSYENVETKITSLLDGEVVTIDGYNEDISTSLPNTHRYNNFNNKFLTLVAGTNNLKVTGNAKITFTYQSKRFI